jgi:hypothetical protein
VSEALEPARKAISHGHPLTPRELKVAACLARRFTRETAEHVVITERNVAAYVAHPGQAESVVTNAERRVAVGQGLLAPETR